MKSKIYQVVLKGLQTCMEAESEEEAIELAQDKAKKCGKSHRLIVIRRLG